MRISVNLASKPFAELRPLLARLRLLMGVLALAAIGLAFGVHALSVRAAAATARMDKLKAATLLVQQQRARNEARMQQPANRALLERATFLNALFARKSFSWTAVMMDLERVLPIGVQVTSIDPVISKEGEVSIRLRVSGDRDRAIALVRNLERSQRFVAPRLAGESALTAEKARAIGAGGQVGSAALLPASLPGSSANGNGGNPADAVVVGVEFEIFSGYNPLPSATAAAVHDNQSKGKPEKPSPDETAADPAGGER